MPDNIIPNSLRRFQMDMLAKDAAHLATLTASTYLHLRSKGIAAEPAVQLTIANMEILALGMDESP